MLKIVQYVMIPGFLVTAKYNALLVSRSQPAIATALPPQKMVWVSTPTFCQDVRTEIC